MRLTSIALPLIILYYLHVPRVGATFECLKPKPLGSESGVLSDSSFTATGYATSREPWKARLNGQFGMCLHLELGNIFLLAYCVSLASLAPQEDGLRSVSGC